MNVTPTPKMLEAMYVLVDATIGEAPGKLETTPAAEGRRRARRIAMDFLHNLVRLSMREGVRRYLQERNLPVQEDHVRPSPRIREAVESALIDTETH